MKGQITIESALVSEQTIAQPAQLETVALHPNKQRFDSARWEEALEPAADGSVIHAGPTSGTCCCSAGPNGQCKTPTFRDLAPLRLSA